MFTADSKLPSFKWNRDKLSVFQVQTPVTLLIHTFFLTSYIPVERYIIAEYDKTIVIFIPVAENVKVTDE